MSKFNEIIKDLERSLVTKDRELSKERENHEGNTLREKLDRE
jgi:hypothetical protein